MTDISEFERLAEADGATFLQIRTTGLWGAVDREGMVIVPYVDGAMSKVEAARLYCEDKGLPPCTPDAILARIVRECGFRFNPAGCSDVKPAGIPI
jgi:hypothetical protein